MTANAQPNAQPAPQQLHGDITRYSLRALLDEARLLMGQEQALQYRLATVLRELDQRAHADGTPLRLPRWLHDHFGLTFGTAREKVRIARALGSLPSIDAAFRDGQLSYSKVRALTRAATSENEAELLAIALQTNAEGVEHIVRSVKQAECIGDVQAMLRSRSLSTRWDDSGALIVQGRLTPEQGEIFLKALAKATEALSSLPSDANEDSYWTRRSDALIQVMADSLGAGGSGKNAGKPGDRHQVIVHVAAETLAETGGTHKIKENNKENNKQKKKNVPAGTLLHPETIRRLACDGGLVTILEDPKGEPLNAGRKTRAIPPSTRRALVSRDRHCQFPGCSQDKYVEGHHIVHWANGGKTKLDNLVLLCGRHHTAVHEFGYQIRRVNHGPEKASSIEFVKPGLNARPGGNGVAHFQNPFVPPP